MPCDVWQHAGGLGEEPATAAAAAASGGQPAAAAAAVQQRPDFTPWGAYSSSVAGKGVKGGGVIKKGGRPQVRSLSVVGVVVRQVTAR